MSNGRRPPGYMTEDLALEITGPPRYTALTDGPVDYVCLRRVADAVALGYFYANDPDGAAGWCPRPSQGAEAYDLATPWVMLLRDAARRGLSPLAALGELAGRSDARSRIDLEPARAPSLEALRRLAEGR